MTHAHQTPRLSEMPVTAILETSAETNSSLAAENDAEAARLKAEASDVYMIAIWYVADGRLHLFRKTHNFPLADLCPSLRLLNDNLQESIPSVGPSSPDGCACRAAD